MSDSEEKLRNLLVYCLALVRMSGAYTGKDSKFNRSEAAERLGENRASANPSRALQDLEQHNLLGDSILDDIRYWPTQYTLDRWIEACKRIKQVSVSRLADRKGSLLDIPSPYDILSFLQVIIELNNVDREYLNIRDRSTLALLFQSFYKVASDPNEQRARTRAENVFKASTQLVSTEGNTLSIDDTIKDLERIIDDGAKQALNYVDSSQLEERFKENISKEENRYRQHLVDLCLRQVRRILVESGAQQSKSIRGYAQQHMSTTFLLRLPETIHHNHRITDKFPVYLDAIDIEYTGPLPLFVASKPNSTTNLLNKTLLQTFERSALLSHMIDLGDSQVKLWDSSLPHQHNYSLRIDFHIKLEASSPSRSNDRYTFSAHGCGSGGLNSLIHLVISSLIHLVISRALLRDIPSLNHYFPVGRILFQQQDLVGHRVSSPVRAHSLIQLCRKDDLAQMITNVDSIDRSTSSVIGVGQADYIGFDLFLTQFRASVVALLDAIWSSSAIPETYIEELLERIAQDEILDKGISMFLEYPYCLLASESYLKISCLSKERRYPFKYPVQRSQYSYDRHVNGILNYLGDNQDQKHLTEREKRDFRQDIETKMLDKYETKDQLFAAILRDVPTRYFDVYLMLVEGYLSEGLYRKAYDYIYKISLILGTLTKEMENMEKEDKTNRFHLFSGAVLAKYEILWARYYLIADCEYEAQAPERRAPEWIPLERSNYLSEAEVALRRADQHLNVRLKKFVATQQTSLGTFSPHYGLKAEICFTHGQIFLFYPSYYVEKHGSNIQYTPSKIKPKDDQHKKRIESIFGSMYWFEQSRLHAALDGSRDRYFLYTVYQCWSYIISSCLLPRYVRSSRVAQDSQYKSKWFLGWADTLLREALLSYRSIGMRSYNQIKEKSGVIENQESSQAQGAVRVDNLPGLFEYRSKENNALIQEIRKRAEEGDKSFPLIFVDLSYLLVEVKEFGSQVSNKKGVYMFGPKACYLMFIRGLYHLSNDRREEVFAFDNSLDFPPVCSLADWITKLDHAYTLFTYAWVMADSFCSVETSRNASDSVEDNAEDQYSRPDLGSEEWGFSIRRHSYDDQSNNHVDDTISNVIRSVGYLYPSRVSEIADLGKIYAATCLYLKQQITADEGEFESLRKSQETLFGKLFSSEYLMKSPISYLSGNQSRFNGFLHNFVRRSKKILSERREESVISPEQALRTRDTVLSEIFAAFDER